MKMKIPLSLALSLVVTTTLASVSYAVWPYEITKITDNDYDDRWPVINDHGQIVWAANGQDYEILYYDGSSTTQISNNDTQDRDPFLNNSGQIVWGGMADGDYEVFLYEGSTPTQITDNSHHDNDPHINENGDIAWSTLSSPPFGFEAYGFYGGSTVGLGSGIVYINDNRDKVLSRLIDDAWHAYLYDSSGETYLGSGIASDINNNGHVVWCTDDDQKDIMFYDGFSSVQISNSPGNYRPKMNENGLVVWQKAVPSDIFLYDGTGVRQITTNGYGCETPYINLAGDIVWSAYGSDDYEIYKATVIPEPFSLLLLGLGLLGTGILRRRKS